MAELEDDWMSPEAIRKIARERADWLKILQQRYRVDLDAARERYRSAKEELRESSDIVDALLENLRPLDGELANLEACVASEFPTIQMFLGKDEIK